MAEELKELVHKPERLLFQYMLAKNPNYFGNIPGSKLKADFKLISDVSYEQITCLGYHPDTAMMEAVFSVKRASGYSGNLCSTGSLEHVRFYLDFHDGAGFIDQGTVAVNVHDLPDDKDCKGQSNFPIQYVASLKKKTVHFSFCDNPVLPTLRAILSWNSDPPANSPDWQPVWGNVMNCDVQLKSFGFFKPPVNINLAEYFQLAAEFPHLSTAEVAGIAEINIAELNVQPASLSFNDLAKKYDKLKVPASRYAYKKALGMVKYPYSEITMQDKTIFNELKLNVAGILDELVVFIPPDTSKANVEYEELDCVGLDYNSETLVATIKIKKKSGYSGDLCDPGSKEYVSFWIDWEDKCKWNYLNTVALKVHDIAMKGDHLCYSVSLPVDANFHRKLCSTPNVIRVRAVLSWNTPPSTTDPNKLEFYGNRVDSHIQIRPGFVINPGEVKPLFNIIGGIDVDHVNDFSGLTLANSQFSYNGLAVPTGAPFGGVIVINGPSFPGHKYRFRITNLNTGTSYYLNNSFTVTGWSPVPPVSPQFVQSADFATNYYTFLPFNQNTLNVLARFTPGTDDKLLVEMEVQFVAGVFSKRIQMDNTAPDVQLTVDDGGDCTHYKKGETITGKFYVNDLYISSWGFGSTWGGGQSGVTNTPAGGTAFSIATPANAYPCGAVSVWAIDKAIIDSQWVGHYVPRSYNVCLQ